MQQLRRKHEEARLAIAQRGSGDGDGDDSISDVEAGSDEAFDEQDGGGFVAALKQVLHAIRSKLEV